MPKSGETHHNARLSDANVRAMRATWARWKGESDGIERKGYGMLGKVFGCGASTARDIVLYRTRRFA
ncbi:MAG: hypothetical protein JNM98_21665 [Rhodocyclaceae bacterium]|nr:hypothetical protein [Rhodocyclaceae bacterium]